MPPTGGSTKERVRLNRRKKDIITNSKNPLNPAFRVVSDAAAGAVNVGEIYKGVKTIPKKLQYDYERRTRRSEAEKLIVEEKISKNLQISDGVYGYSDEVGVIDSDGGMGGVGRDGYILGNPRTITQDVDVDDGGSITDTDSDESSSSSSSSVLDIELGVENIDVYRISDFVDRDRDRDSANIDTDGIYTYDYDIYGAETSTSISTSASASTVVDSDIDSDTHGKDKDNDGDRCGLVSETPVVAVAVNDVAVQDEDASRFINMSAFADDGGDDDDDDDDSYGYGADDFNGALSGEVEVLEQDKSGSDTSDKSSKVFVYDGDTTTSITSTSTTTTKTATKTTLEDNDTSSEMIEIAGGVIVIDTVAEVLPIVNTTPERVSDFLLLAVDVTLFLVESLLKAVSPSK